MTQVLHTVEKHFSDRFGRNPQVVAAAPGRVNLIGGHVDYHDGIVVPMAIDRYTAFAGRRKEGKEIVTFSQNFDQPLRYDLKTPIVPQQNSWSNYVLGVVSEFQKLGRTVPGFETAIVSDVPIGGGLSSSAALTVATATFLESLLQVALDPTEKALLCQRAENQFAGVPCGVMDPLVSTLASKDHLLKIDCQSLDYESIPWDSNQFAVLVINTGVSHQLGDSEYAVRREQSSQALTKLGCNSYRQLSDTTLDEMGPKTLSDVEYRRAHHVVTEIGRSVEFVDALSEGDWLRAGRQLFASHRSLRDDYEVSCPELDFLVATAHQMGSEGGVFGMRMTGGGFGGCTVAIVERVKAQSIMESLHRAFANEFGYAPESFITQPAHGALGRAV